MNAQTARDIFWKHFDNYVEKMGNEFYVTHVKGGKNQAAGNINNNSPMAMQTLCCEYKYLENVILIQLYLNQKPYPDLYEYLYSKKEEIEDEFGYAVEWVDRGMNSSTVRRIQKSFYISRPIDEMIKIIYPYIKDFIRVFGKYV